MSELESRRRTFCCDGTCPLLYLFLGGAFVSVGLLMLPLLMLSLLFSVWMQCWGWAWSLAGFDLSFFYNKDLEKEREKMTEIFISS